MSKKGYKTINLPQPMTERIDALVRERKVWHRSREEFVRHATALMLFATENPKALTQHLNEFLDPLERRWRRQMERQESGKPGRRG